MANPDISSKRRCATCAGSGEVGSEVGPIDCPDCGGGGQLPDPHVLVEWRARDIERVRGQSGPQAADIRWLVSELRRARTALTEIATLSEELGEGELPQRIRITAGEALRWYEVYPAEPEA